MSVYETSITNPKKQLEFYKDLSEQLQQENQQLKKQLHEASLEIQHLIEQDIDCPSNCNKLRKLKNQQKEFIKWLEDYIDTLKTESDSVEGLGICEYYTLLAFEEALSKYKEIIGGSNANISRR